MATFTTTSKYVQVTPYLLMEYMYADQPNPETYFVNTGNPTVSYNKLINNSIKEPNGTNSTRVQIFNQNQNYEVTKNTSLNSVVKISENSFAPLNQNYIIPYNDFDSNLTPTVNLPVSFSSNFSITYDTIRYHILSGYNLENIDGLIIGIDFQDVDGSYVTFSQILLDSGFSEQYTLNPNPISIGINTYNKYFETKIPSLLFLNNQYIAAVNKNLTPGSLLSKSGRGFVVGSPMRIRPYEILNTSLESGYSIFGANLLSVLSLESEDPFTNIGAQISPAETGDFFEYFATDNNGFIEDFILFQNSIGNQYFIQNEIQVIEQIGTALVETSNFFTVQTNAYDIPNLFRPIIRNSGVASSFTLRYTMTLVNNKDRSRVVRNASYTSNFPAKYGSFIAPLQLQNLPQPQKIYNKIANQTSITVPGTSNSPKVIIKYNNVYFERNLVTTFLTNLVVRGTQITAADGDEEQIVYGQGKAFISIFPFDNYFKFTFTKKTPSGDTQFIDLESSGSYYLVFVNNSNQKISVPTISDKNVANPARGELAFKVSETISLDVLQYTDRRYFISNTPPNGTENTLDLTPLGPGVKNAIAAKTTSLKPTLSDVFSSSERLNRDLLIISSDSSSILYWGYWIKQGEVGATSESDSGRGKSAPLTQLTEISVQGGSENLDIRIDPLDLSSSVADISNITEFAIGTSGILDSPPVDLTRLPFNTQFGANVSGSGFTVQGPVVPSVNLNTGTNKLTPTEIRSAIASEVQGQFAQEWKTPDIISYFLDPSQIGYKLYGGITKEVFQEAVTGIFSNTDLILLDNYGNTGGGQTNGGPAANSGNTSNQTGFSSTIRNIIKKAKPNPPRD